MNPVLIFAVGMATLAALLGFVLLFMEFVYWLFEPDGSEPRPTFKRLFEPDESEPGRMFKRRKTLGVVAVVFAAVIAWALGTSVLEQFLTATIP